MTYNWDKVKEQVEIITKQLRETKGFRELYRLTEGEHVITIDLESLPRQTNTVYGERIVIPIKIDNKDMGLMISPTSPLCRNIVEIVSEALSQGRKTVTVRIVRVGRGRATRYTVSKI